jgi:hypothetical protein
MPDIARIPVVWSGFSGGPGVNTFYSDVADVDIATTALHTFYEAIDTFIPDVVDINVPGSGDTISDSSGILTGTWTATATPAQVNGGATGTYAAPVGAVVNWLTSAIVDGRRLQGKSFIVPLTDAAFDSDGSIVSGFLTTLRNAAAALAATADSIKVWHRPTDPGPSGGSSAAVTSSRVPDLAAVLRSRRD